MLAIRINARIGQCQSLNRLPANDVRFDDFVNVGRGYAPIPHPVRIDNKIGPMLALVETAGFIGPNFVLQPALGQLLLEDPL